MKTFFILSLATVCFVTPTRGDVKEALDAQERGDYETARKEFESLADRGDDKAMISLGLMYHTGEGAKQDYEKAMEWYLKAYAKRNGDALNNIGVMYRDGLGIAKNPKIAYLLFLAVHMEGLGTESTQIRAGRNLSRLAESLPGKDIEEALSYTWSYVDQIVKSRGENVGIGKDVLPAANRPRIRDNEWWLDSEREKMDFESPPPWNVKGGSGLAGERTAGLGAGHARTKLPLTPIWMRWGGNLFSVETVEPGGADPLWLHSKSKAPRGGWR